MQHFEFFVAGIPRGKGSTKAFWNKKAKKVIITRDNPDGVAWESRITEIASKILKPRQGPVSLSVSFYFERPKAHFKKAGLRNDAPDRPITRIDGDKLFRAVGDSLTSVAYFDDSQVVSGTFRKFYCRNGDQPGANIVVRYLETAPEKVANPIQSRIPLPGMEGVDDFG